MKKHTFIWGAVILTVGGFLAKVIGAFYKIPLTNILGSNGMGIYYLVFPLYSLLLVFSSSGVGIAVTKLVAHARANKNKPNETRYFFAGLLISFLVSCVLSLLMVIFSDKLAFYQGNMLSQKGFIAIAPALVSASLVTVIKAYFQGIENMIPSSISMIIEQITKLVFGLILAYKLLPYGLEYGVLGSILAVSISEILTLIIMAINYVWHKKHNDKKFYEIRKEKLKEIFVKVKIKRYIHIISSFSTHSTLYFFKDHNYISFGEAIKQTFRLIIPNTLTSLVIPLITFADSFLVLNLLTKSGFSSFTATSMYGISNGIVASLISLPIIITSSLATAVVPNLSGLISSGRREEINKRTSFFIKITWLIVLPIFVYFALMAFDIIDVLYNFNSNNVINEYAFACKLLLISSVSIIYNAFLSTFVSVLQSLNKSYRAFLIMIIGAILRIILLIMLVNIPNINIFGVIIANIIFLIFCDIFCIVEIKKSVQLQVDFIRSLFIPMVCASISAVMSFATKQIFYNNLWVRIIASGVVCVTSYLVLLILLNAFDEQDIKYIPILSKLRK